MNPLRLALPLILALLATGCQHAREPVFRDQYLAFGTLIDVTFYGVDPVYAKQVSTEIEQQFQRWHHDWHAWEPGLLTDTNARLATLQPFTLDPALIPLITEANRLSKLSNDMFNPVIGKLIALWGFQSNPLPPGTQPDPDATEQWLENAPTALFVAGPSDWLVIAQQMGIDRVMLVDSAGTIHISPATQAIIEMAPDIDAEVRVSES